MQNTTFRNLNAAEQDDVVTKAKHMITPIPSNSKESKHMVVAKPVGSPHKRRIMVTLVPKEGKVLCTLTKQQIYPQPKAKA